MIHTVPWGGKETGPMLVTPQKEKTPFSETDSLADTFFHKKIFVFCGAGKIFFVKKNIFFSNFWQNFVKKKKIGHLKKIT